MSYPLGCSSGNVTGTSADLARCVVVRLALAANNLSGALNGSILKLPSLYELDLSSNNLTGDLHASLSSMAVLQTVQLATNAFTYTTSDPTYTVLWDCHRIGGLDCAGYYLLLTTYY